LDRVRTISTRAIEDSQFALEAARPAAVKVRAEDPEFVIVVVVIELAIVNQFV
jgi:hypothetical protein